MNIFGHLGNSFKNYFKFAGRSGISEYIIITILWNIFYIPFYVINAHAKSVGGVANLSSSTKDALFIFGILSLIIVIPNISVGVRRAHDIGKSGWYLWIPFYSLYLLGAKSDPSENQYGEPVE